MELTDYEKKILTKICAEHIRSLRRYEIQTEGGSFVPLFNQGEITITKSLFQKITGDDLIIPYDEE